MVLLCTRGTQELKAAGMPFHHQRLGAEADLHASNLACFRSIKRKSLFHVMYVPFPLAVVYLAGRKAGTCRLEMIPLRGRPRATALRALRIEAGLLPPPFSIS